MIRTWDEIRRDVARGARLLDRKKKSWVKDLVESGIEYGFDLSSGESCVLGSVFRKLTPAGRSGYLFGTSALDIPWASEYGFNVNGTEESTVNSWQMLTEAWQTEVLVRLAKTRKLHSFISATIGFFQNALAKIS